MKGLKEKVFFVGMYLTVFLVTLICFWGFESTENNQKIDNKVIVMNEK